MFLLGSSFFCSFFIAILVFLGSSPCLAASTVKPTHFVIHCTDIADGGAGDAFYERYAARKRREGATNRGHGLIAPSGKYLQFWPLSRRDVHGTKTETCAQTRGATYGRFINIEVGYYCSNPAKTETPTAAQYSTLADIYAEAYRSYGPLTIVSHKEVDRGLHRGHGDPYNFNFEALYIELANRNLDLSAIQRISNDRHSQPSGGSYSHFAPPQLTGRLVTEDVRPDDCKAYPTPRR